MNPLATDALLGCRAYLRAHAKLKDRERKPFPVVTISREAGAGALCVAELTTTLLNQAQSGKNRPPWTVFDKNIVEKALDDHELPGELKRFMPEDVRPFMTDTVEELLGLHPSHWTLVQQTTETILRLARLGNVILVGRAAHIITAAMENAVHVRLVAPEEKRARFLSRTGGMTTSEAHDYIRKTDRARRRYVYRFFDASVDDPLCYTMVLNTGRISFQTAAHLIAVAVEEKMA